MSKITNILNFRSLDELFKASNIKQIHNDEMVGIIELNCSIILAFSIDCDKYSNILNVELNLNEEHLCEENNLLLHLSMGQFKSKLPRIFTLFDNHILKSLIEHKYREGTLHQSHLDDETWVEVNA